MGDFSFDASSMDALTRDLKMSADRFKAETDRTLIEVGEIVKTAAKKIAQEEGSSSIPGTIKAIPGPDMVVVTAGDSSVPLAALWDLGNRGKGGRKSRTFGHPVFAQGSRDQWTWVEQERHPILKRARLVSRRAINDLMNGAYDRVLEPLRRRV